MSDGPGLPTVAAASCAMAMPGMPTSASAEVPMMKRESERAVKPRMVILPCRRRYDLRLSRERSLSPSVF
jgi:hypothetical protein